MKFALAFIWALIPPIVLAHSGATGVVKERMERFEQSKEEMKALRAAIKQNDAMKAREIAKSLTQWASVMTQSFPENSNPAPSEALDRIWQDWQGFVEAAVEFERAALAVEAKPDMSGFKDLGQSCKGCHDNYRE